MLLYCTLKAQESKDLVVLSHDYDAVASSTTMAQQLLQHSFQSGANYAVTLADDTFVFPDSLFEFMEHTQRKVNEDVRHATGKRGKRNQTELTPPAIYGGELTKVVDNLERNLNLSPSLAGQEIAIQSSPELAADIPLILSRSLVSTILVRPDIHTLANHVRTTGPTVSA